MFPKIIFSFELKWIRRLVLRVGCEVSYLAIYVRRRNFTEWANCSHSWHLVALSCYLDEGDRLFGARWILGWFRAGLSCNLDNATQLDRIRWRVANWRRPDRQMRFYNRRPFWIFAHPLETPYSTTPYYLNSSASGVSISWALSHVVLFNATFDIGGDIL